MKILYEDNHLLIVDKPAGLLTQPSGTSQESLEELAKNWIKEHYQKPGKVFLEAIHRLDKPVSGIILFCKTTKALSRLNAAMRAKKIHKTYYALVEGDLKQEAGVLEHYLVHDDYRASTASPKHPEAKLARLKLRVIERKGDATLLEIELETGRYHQIRAQLASIGHPIVGDRRYGSQREWGPDAIALHHGKMVFPHPITQEQLTIHSSLEGRDRGNCFQDLL